MAPFGVLQLSTSCACLFPVCLGIYSSLPLRTLPLLQLVGLACCVDCMCWGCMQAALPVQKAGSCRGVCWACEVPMVAVLRPFPRQFSASCMPTAYGGIYSAMQHQPVLLVLAPLLSSAVVPVLLVGWRSKDLCGVCADSVYARQVC
jgi:hypothetical protein